ncbi:15901_t:CDS:1, partial [Gigaspora margarita]
IWYIYTTYKWEEDLLTSEAAIRRAEARIRKEIRVLYTGLEGKSRKTKLEYNCIRKVDTARERET